LVVVNKQLNLFLGSNSSSQLLSVNLWVNNLNRICSELNLVVQEFSVGEVSQVQVVKASLAVDSPWALQDKV
jgi:hypothetical protein